MNTFSALPPPSGGFRVTRIITPTPLFRERPAEDEPYLQFADQDGFRCFVAARAVLQMARWGYQAGGREMIGHLAGRPCTDSAGDYTLVERVTQSRQATGGPAHVIADHTAQEAMRRALERTCRPLDCVGWWHSHPHGIGLFYSHTDRQNQATWSNPNAVGIVIDPCLKREGFKVFRGPGAVELRPIHKTQRERLLAVLRSRVCSCGREPVIPTPTTHDQAGGPSPPPERMPRPAKRWSERLESRQPFAWRHLRCWWPL